MCRQTNTPNLPYGRIEKGLSSNRKGKKTGKAGSQQVLGKDGDKYTTTRSHGMGLVMTLPKEWDGPPDF